MSKNIDRNGAAIWKFLQADKGWWSVLRLTSHWAPKFPLRAVEEHLVSLHRCGFVESRETHNMGTVYAVTPACFLLPTGECPQAVQAAASPLLVPPARPKVMSGHYCPPTTSLRPGALDHMRHPSLHMGQRRAHQGGMQ